MFATLLNCSNLLYSWVFEQENYFIMWAAYGRRLEMHSDSPYIIRNSKPDKVYENFTQKDCEEHFQGGHNGTVFTNCNAGEDGNKGMGRILQVSHQVFWQTGPERLTRVFIEQAQTKFLQVGCQRL